jgi:hypothetical protein
MYIIFNFLLFQTRTLDHSNAICRMLETGLNLLWLRILVSSGQDSSLVKFCLFENWWHRKASCLGFLLVGGTIDIITRLCKHAIVDTPLFT